MFLGKQKSKKKQLVILENKKVFRKTKIQKRTNSDRTNVPPPQQR